jgi:hypothetical protein
VGLITEDVEEESGVFTATRKSAKFKHFLDPVFWIEGRIVWSEELREAREFSIWARVIGIQLTI